MANAAVVLAGCGFLDGSEIHEAVSVLIHLSRHSAKVQCFAPDRPQADVMNHAAKAPAKGETRNIMVEAARIARGDIKPLSALKAKDFDCVLFPGGFGAAKNLCDFASKGANCTVDTDVARVIKEFHSAGKPIGLCCIAPILAAQVLGTKAGGPGVVVTLGSDKGIAGTVKEMGSTHKDRRVDESCWDDKNKVGTAPAYMYGDAAVHDVFDGIGEMVGDVLGRVPSRV